MPEALPSGRRYAFGPYCLDVSRRRLQRDGETVRLRSKIFDTLLALVENRGHVVEKTELMRLVWPDSTVEESNLTHNVSVLRKCLETKLDDASYIVTVSGTGYRFVAPVEAPLEASIAVLPFVNMSSDPEQDFFCDGMADELINALTQVDGLRVVARTSSFAFRDVELGATEVGERLGVATLLEGSVRKSGKRIRITAQLVRTSDGFHLWSERYDRELSDVFTIQDDIARAIVEHATSEIMGRPAAPMVKMPTANQEVYNLYLEARYHRADESREGVDRAIELLGRALDLQPDFAPGHAFLALCYTSLSLYGLVPLAHALPNAERAVARALELDDSLVDAHRALGNIRSTAYWDWPAAQRAFKCALRLDPRAPGPHRSYASNFLAPLGRLEEAEQETRIALDLDPVAPLCSRLLGQILFWSRQYEAAVLQLRHTLELNADFPIARSLLAAVYTAMDQPDDAIREREIHLRRRGRDKAAEHARGIYEAAGEEGVLHWQVENALRQAKAGKSRPCVLALLYAQLDDRESAFHWLEAAITQKGGLILYAKVHPWFESLHSDSRLDALLNRMGVNDPLVATPGAVV